MQGTTGKAENWRLRQLMATQISEVCQVLAVDPGLGKEGAAGGGGEGRSEDRSQDKESAWSFVVPLFLQLCNDSVAEVRSEAAKAVVNMLRTAAPELFADPGAGE